MFKENKVIIDAVVKNLSNEYEITAVSVSNRLSRKKLINKLIIAEAIVQILKEKNIVLEWQNIVLEWQMNVWNSADKFKLR
jgi:hypothetical protein